MERGWRRSEGGDKSRRLLQGGQRQALQNGSGSLLLASSTLDVDSRIAAHETLEFVVAVTAAQRGRGDKQGDADAVDEYHRYREVHCTCVIYTCTH